MCQIIISENHQFEPGLILSLYSKNRDGIGFLEFGKDKQPIKFMPKDIDEAILWCAENVIGKAGVMHWRMRTDGATDIDRVHPYPVGEHGWLFHNGVLQHYRSNHSEVKSDTQKFAESTMLKLTAELTPDAVMASPTILKILGDYVGSGNKLVFVSGDDYCIVNESAGTKIEREFNGVKQTDWFSNTYAMSTDFWPKQFPKHTGNYQGSGYVGGSYSGGKWEGGKWEGGKWVSNAAALPAPSGQQPKANRSPHKLTKAESKALLRWNMSKNQQKSNSKQDVLGTINSLLNHRLIESRERKVFSTLFSLMAPEAIAKIRINVSSYDWSRQMLGHFDNDMIDGGVRTEAWSSTLWLKRALGVSRLYGDEGFSSIITPDAATPAQNDDVRTTLDGKEWPPAQGDFSDQMGMEDHFGIWGVHHYM